MKVPKKIKLPDGTIITILEDIDDGASDELGNGKLDDHKKSSLASNKSPQEAANGKTIASPAPVKPQQTPDNNHSDIDKQVRLVSMLARNFIGKPPTKTPEMRPAPERSHKIPSLKPTNLDVL